MWELSPKELSSWKGSNFSKLLHEMKEYREKDEKMAIHKTNFTPSRYFLADSFHHDQISKIFISRYKKKKKPARILGIYIPPNTDKHNLTLMVFFWWFAVYKFLNICFNLDWKTKPKGLADAENIQDGESHRKIERSSKTCLLTTQRGAKTTETPYFSPRNFSG